MSVLFTIFTKDLVIIIVRKISTLALKYDFIVLKRLKLRLLDVSLKERVALKPNCIKTVIKRVSLKNSGVIAWMVESRLMKYRSVCVCC